MGRRYKGQTKPRRLKKASSQGINNDAGEDERFVDLAKNPMFREMAKKERKIVINDRFKQMLSDKRFEERNTKMVDKRGRPLRHKGDNFLTHLYELDQTQNEEENKSATMDGSDESCKGNNGEQELNEYSETDETDNEECDVSEQDEDQITNLQPIHLDIARGEAPQVSSSSEDEEEYEEELSDNETNTPKEQEENDLLEVMERGVTRVEWASRRLAVCNVDWSKMTAEDLMLVLNSFKPSSGSIQSVAVYLSDFGAERLKQEKKHGPLLNLKPAKKRGMGRSEASEEDDLEQRTRQAIRAYELDKLRYYYAVCECDSLDTATAIYEACDGVEYEASGMRFDLRFIPDNMQFEDNRLRDRKTLDQLHPEYYKPKRHIESHPLVCSNPKISWEQLDPERRQLMRNAFSEETKFEEFESLIGEASDKEDEQKQAQRYEILMREVREAKHIRNSMDQDNDEGNVSEKQEEERQEKLDEHEARSVDQEDDNNTDDEPWGQNHTKEKKKTKFQIYLEKKKRLKSERKQMEVDKRKARKHQRMTKSEKEKSETINDTMVEKDDRFKALFTDSVFAIDCTHAQYKGGDLAHRQVYEKAKKRQTEADEIDHQKKSKRNNILEVEDKNDENPISTNLVKTDQWQATEAIVKRLRKKVKHKSKQERE